MNWQKKSGTNLGQHFVALGAKPTKKFSLNVVFNVALSLAAPPHWCTDGV